ncbi:hypothetical protein [Nocardia sp. 348MFTsu5.1]|uniref:hypothetical protein n=1 Tax=Nocardia sp. 348MFTsu5.1 TaxID=1172185 RepID=UPI00037010CA|nr:hypothetical protein [Nocardia sp. 348MFTsu5.1]
MIVAAIGLLAATALAPLLISRLPLGHGRLTNIAAAMIAPAILGLVAILGLLADPADGAGAVVIYCLTLAAAVTGGTLMVRAALLLGGIEPWQLDTPPPADPPADPAPVPTPLRGGRVIGYLERIVVVAALSLQWPEAIAIVLAVKGLGRYPELREPGAAEQFIIGTLASVLWAAATAGAAYLLLH